MDRQSFDSIDASFQEALENLRAKIIAEVEAEQEKNKGFKFGTHEASLKLAKYPYIAEEKKKALQNHEQALAIRAAEKQADIEERLARQRHTLEQHIFGELGRQHALEQAHREGKIQDFKDRQRQREEKTHQKSKDLGQPKEIIGVQKEGFVPQQDSLSPAMSAQKKTGIEKIGIREDFKNRMREEFNKNSAEIDLGYE